MHFLQSRLWQLCLVVIILLWCLGLGWGTASALDNPEHLRPITQVPADLSTLKDKKVFIPANPRSVDPIPTRYQPGFESYLETCSTCHIALPPEVLPLESWQQILRRPEKHYGTSVPNFNRFTQLLIWDYVSNFSRPLPPDSPVPLYAEKSRYFKALHPKVPIPADMTAQTCVACHPNVTQFDFRTLSSEWQEAN